MTDTPRRLTEAECQYIADVTLRGWGERDPMGPPVVRIAVSDLEALVRRCGDAEWALGETDFRGREPGDPPYWWRTELRRRAFGERPDATKGGPDCE